MSKKNMYKFGLTAMGGTILVSAMIATAIANRGIPYHTDQEMRDAQRNLETSDMEYCAARDALIQEARSQFTSTQEYHNTVQKIGDLDYTDPEYKKIESQLDSLEENFINNHLMHNEDELDYRCHKAAEAFSKYFDMQRDSTRAAEMLRVPFTTRLKNNWNDIQREYHNKKIQQHQTRLNKLQRTK